MDAEKLLWKQGNLYKGYPYGVLVTKPFDSVEYHGPFSTENEAWNYGMALANESNGAESFTLVKLETPMVRDIATAEEIRRYRNPEDESTRLRREERIRIYGRVPEDGPEA